MTLIARGIELRTLWHREVVDRARVRCIIAKPGYWKKDVLLTWRRDPPWRLTIKRNGQSTLVLRGRRTVIEAAAMALQPSPT